MLGYRIRHSNKFLLENSYYFYNPLQGLLLSKHAPEEREPAGPFKINLQCEQALPHTHIIEIHSAVFMNIFRFSIRFLLHVISFAYLLPIYISNY